MTAEFFEGFMEDYFAECEEHLVSVRRILLALESTVGHGDPPPAIVEELFRSFHSLKGISAMVELRPAEQLAHELENYLRAARAGEVAVTTDAISLLIEGTQLLEQIINARRLESVPPPIDEVVARIAAAVPRRQALGLAPPDGAAIPVEIEPVELRSWKCTSPTRELFARGLGSMRYASGSAKWDDRRGGSAREA